MFKFVTPDCTIFAFSFICPDLLLSFVISFKTRFYKPASTKVWYIQRNALNWIGGSTNQYVHEGIVFKKAFTIKRLILPPNYFTWILFSEKNLGVFFVLFFTENRVFLRVCQLFYVWRHIAYERMGSFVCDQKGRWIIEEERLEISSTPVILSWLWISLWTNHKLYAVTFYVNWTRDPFVNGYQSVRELSHPTVLSSLSAIS